MTRARSVLAIGGSAGAIKVLTGIVASLPADFPAAVFVALHTAPEARSRLPEILARAGVLIAQHAVDGEPIEAGRIYVAPPDHHLLVTAEHMCLSRGPRENGHRPAIDPLFRSAARSFGAGAMAVVLSGAADDGAAGILAIHEAGGLTAAQDPHEALHPSMPQSSIDTGGVDRVLSADDIGPFLAETFGVQNRFLQNSLPEAGTLAVETILPEDASRTIPSGFSCPECHGTLFEVDDDRLTRFRCRIGHAYSEQSLEAEQRKAVENALWIAVRALEERAALLEQIADRLTRLGSDIPAGRMQRESAEARDGANSITDFLGLGSHMSHARAPDPSGVAGSG